MFIESYSKSRHPNMQFQDKVVILTGAGSGIGAATALKFASLGAKLTLVDKNEAGLNETLEQCINKENHLVHVADLLKTEDVFSIIPVTIERFGKIDVLVNCAGVLRFDNFDEDVTPNYDLVMAVNLKAPVQLVNKAIPYLKETKGNIVNVCSSSSRRANHYYVMYAVSKAGLDMFTQCMAIELASYGIRVNSVHPGPVKTNIMQGIEPSFNRGEKKENFAKSMPFGIAEPEEIAKVIVFLANNEDAKRVTGSAYYVDGGMTLFQSRTFGGKF